MKNQRDRTQRDLDIIKQSSLKAAVDLAIGILPTLETRDELSDLVLRIADKFNTYVLDGDAVQRTVNQVREELREPEPDPVDRSYINNQYEDDQDWEPGRDEPESELERAQRHVKELQEQERQSHRTGQQRKTDEAARRYREDSQRRDREEQEQRGDDDIHTLFENLKRDLSRQPNSWKKMTDRELEGWTGGRWIQRGKLTWGASQGDPFPISSKQYGFAMALCKENGLDPDPQFMNGLSTHGAGLLLDHLQEMRGNGNGKRDRRR